MLRYFAAVEAVYFYHRYTKQFLGIDKPSNFGFEQVVPVKNMSQAVDFKIQEGGVTPLTEYNPKNLADITEKPSSAFIRIMHPTLNKSFDAQSGKGNYGDKLILHPSHNEKSQKFFLRMLSNFSFILSFQGKCMKYNESKNNFELGICRNLQQSAFDLYLETTPENKVIKEETIKLSEDIDSEFRNDNNVLNYSTGTNTRFIRPKSKNVTKITFKGDKVTKSGQHMNDVVLGKEEVGIKTVVKKIRPVKPTRTHHHHHHEHGQNHKPKRILLKKVSGSHSTESESSTCSSDISDPHGMDSKLGKEHHDPHHRSSTSNDHGHGNSADKAKSAFKGLTFG